MGEWCLTPRILDLGTNWKRVVNYTPRPLYSLYPLDRRQGGPQSRNGQRGEEKILPLPGLEVWPLGRPARSQSLYWLLRMVFIAENAISRSGSGCFRNKLWEEAPSQRSVRHSYLFCRRTVYVVLARRSSRPISPPNVPMKLHTARPATWQAILSSLIQEFPATQ
jgi:hypothetical protein